MEMMMTEQTELRPCPDCGSPATLRRTYGNSKVWYWVECTDCRCQTGEHDDTGAVSTWNRRAASSEPAPAGDCKHEQITYAAGGYFCDRCGAMVTVDAPAGDALAELAGEAAARIATLEEAIETELKWHKMQAQVDAGDDSVTQLLADRLGSLALDRMRAALRARQLQERNDE